MILRKRLLRLPPRRIPTARRHRFTLWGLLLLLLFLTASQPPPRYLFPIEQARNLSGTFGELRGRHFHAGMDIRTFGTTGLPVRAAADGYISRVGVWYYGYGKALYVQHRDGTSSVYAHLERFMPELEQVIRRKQYAEQRFMQEEFYGPGRFPVRQGQIIGWSGNTGASGGPHLHYEIRDAASRILNPLAFHRDDVQDYLPPVLNWIAFTPLETEARVQGRFETLLRKPYRSGTTYSSNEVFRVRGRVGFMFSALDRDTGHDGRNGLYTARLYLDGKQVFGYRMDRYAFWQGRYVLQHLDYGYREAHDIVLEKTWLEPGNQAPFYLTPTDGGILELTDDQPHSLKLVLGDYHGNVVRYQAVIQRETPNGLEPDPLPNDPIPEGRTTPAFEVHRNTLVLRTPPSAKCPAQVFYPDRSPQPLKPAYTTPTESVFLLRLESGAVLPDSIRGNGCSWGKTVIPGFRKWIEPEEATGFNNGEGVRAWFPAGSVFRSTPLSVRKRYSPNPAYCSPIYEIGDFRHPLAKPFSLRIEADRNTGVFTPHQRVLLEIKPDGSFNRFSRAQNGATVAKRFGRYVLVGDREPPVIRPMDFEDGGRIGPDQHQLNFEIRDTVAEVNPWAVTLKVDGQWAVGEYYQYQERLVFRLRPRPEPGRHTLEVIARDHAGNTGRASFTVEMD